MNYWLNTVSLNHVKIGVEGGFTQTGHGKSSGLNKMQASDLIVFYSPRTKYRDGKSLQTFTAIGKITDEEPYQVEMRPDFNPWRRKVEFFECEEAPIRPLVDELNFIEDKNYWGFPFRRGLFQIEKQDFKLIAKAMGITL